MINEVKVNNQQKWQDKHLKMVKQYYIKSPYYTDIVGILEILFSKGFEFLCDITIESIKMILDYFNLKDRIEIIRSSTLDIPGKSTERVLSIVKHFDCNQYLTAMGALRYFDFKLLEKHNIRTYFINYSKQKYPQLFGEFNPYVSSLDLIANCGLEGKNYLTSELIYWKEFIKTKEAQEYLKRFKE